MKRVAVTGLEGFTGRYVKTALEAKGFEVVGVKSDITDGVSLAYEIEAIRPSSVLHLAAISFPAHDDHKEIYNINLHGSVNLFRAIKKTKSVKKTVLASSSNVYGIAEGAVNEECPPNPVNHYGISKYAMERAAFAEGIECIIARAFNYTGVGQAEHFLVPKIVSHFKAKKEIIELGNIDIARDFSDVRWVADVYANLISSDIKNGIFNVCSKKAISLQEVISHLSEISGHKIEIRVNPAFVRENEIKTVFGNNDRLKNSVLGVGESMDIKDTLKWMLNS